MIPGRMALPHMSSTFRTASMTWLFGRATIISLLHCGHSILLGRPRARFGASTSAIQSSRQASCAVSAQGQGLRHSEDMGVSSLSSAKHIQHLRRSFVSWRCGGLGLSDCLPSRSGGSSEGLEGLFRSTVCESSDIVELSTLREWDAWPLELVRGGGEGRRCCEGGMEAIAT